MRALLIQHGCEAALEVLPADMEAEIKAELNRKAHSAVILCLGNKVPREVTGETTAAWVWSKLETLYMTNIIRTLCGYLALWTGSFDFEGRDGHTKFKEINERSKAKEDDGKGLHVRGRTSHRDSHQSREKSRSKSRSGRIKCYICQSEDHLKRNCPKNNCKKSIGYVKKDEQPSSSGLTYDDSEVMMVKSVQAQPLLDWIIDSGCSYHMTHRNLISLGTFEIIGYTVKLQSGKVKVINGSRVILSGIRRDNCVYSLDGHEMAGEINASAKEKDSLVQVWHKILGHISEAGLQALEKQGLFGKKSLGKLDFCENYVLGKSHRLSFGVGRHNTQGVIDYVHSDLWGPSQVESLGGKRYFLSIVDNYSRRLWVYILRFKHEAFRKFKEWKQLVDNQTERTVKKLMTNNEATCTAAYLINRSPSRAIEKKTPMEMWSGHPSDYGMLKIFGCVAYPHNKQGKLESRAVKCVLLRYPEGVKWYTLYRLHDESPKIVTSRNMVEVELQRLNNHALEEDQTDQEDRNDEDSGDQETDQPPDLTDYQLVRDKEPRTRTKPLRFRGESNMATYVFVAAEEEDTHKPLTYQEAVSYEDSSKYKARLVARGFTQRAGIDYNEVFSLVVRHTSIRVILALTACKDYELEQLEVKTTFLHGNLEEVIYMKEPPRYEQGNKVCLLKKSLYGLKQSPRQWSYAAGEYIYLLLYVDDMLIACKSKAEIGSIKSLLKKEFNMKELGEAKKILGMEIVRDGSRKILRVSQFRDCDVERMSKVPYANTVGSLVYLMVCTRPDIAYAVSVVSRYLANLDYAKDLDKGRSITGYTFLVHGCVVSWKATLQHVVTLSTTEVEYMALTEAVKEAIWLRGLLEELGVELNTIVVLEAKTVKVRNVGTEPNSANALTKPKVEIVEFSLYFSKSPGYSSVKLSWVNLCPKSSPRVLEFVLPLISIKEGEGERIFTLFFQCDNMSSIKAWDETISKMKKRLSRNFFNGIQDGDRKIACVKWSKVLASKKYGGLGVSRFYALNRALLFKW
nr:retrotransposon protein, putative, Ty1-copia subclass [Tanacetum cinerariifolium]